MEHPQEVTALEEKVARAICVAGKVDPERQCHGLGKLMPDDWSGPAWMVRLESARAAIAIMKEMGE